MAALKVTVIQLSISEYVGQAHHAALCEALWDIWGGIQHCQGP